MCGKKAALQGDETGDPLTDRKVTPDYSPALNVPLIRGRGFTRDYVSSAQPVVILGWLLAARLFPGADPIGRRVSGRTVAGVAENVKNGGLVEPDAPEIYFLRGKSESDWEEKKPIMVISSVLTPQAVARWVHSQIAGIDPAVPVKIETRYQAVS